MKLILNSSLLFWLCSFILGILAFLSDVGIELLGVCFFFFILGIILSRTYASLSFYVICHALFFALGYVSIEQWFPVKNKQIVSEEIFYYGIVEQQMNEGEVWSSSIVNIQFAYDQEKKWMSLNEKVVLMTENDGLSILKNDRIVFSAQLNEITVRNNPGEFDARKYYVSKGIRYNGFSSKDDYQLIDHVPLPWFEQVLVDSRNYSTQILDKWVGPKDAPLIKAILLGDKSDLDVETKRVFMNTGAMHMLAVSGMHIGLIVVLLIWIFKRLFFYRGRVVAMICMIVLLWFYAFLTGFSASVVRAVAMFTVLIVAQLLKRGYQPINSLSVAGFFILLVDPLAIFDVGFQLSFLAMLGIFTVYPLLENVLQFKNYILDQAWQGTAIGLASQVFTVPISIYYFNQFPNYFLLTNFAVMLFSGIMLGLAIGLLAIGKLALLSIPVGWFLALCCSMLVGFIAFVEYLPGALAVGFSPHWSWVILTYIFCFLSLAWMERKRWILLLTCLVPIVIWLQANRFENLSRQEVVFFNASFPIVLVNNGASQVCFYAGLEKGKKQAERAIGDYQKLHAGEVTFIPFSDDEVSVYTAKDSIFILKENGWIAMQVGQQKIALVTSLKVDLQLFDRDVKLVSMRANADPAFDANLSNGALRFPID